MIGSIQQGGFEVHQRIARNHAHGRRTFDASFHTRNELPRNGATGNLTFEAEAFTIGQWFDAQRDLRKLTGAPILLFIALVEFLGLRDRFTIGNLGFAYANRDTKIRFQLGQRHFQL